MPLIETEDELREFFDTEDGFGVVTRVSAKAPADLEPEDFDIRFPAIVDDGTQAVELYGDTNVEAPSISFAAVDIDLVGVQTGMVVTFPEIDSADPIHSRLIGKMFTVKRIAASDPGTSNVYLKE